MSHSKFTKPSVVVNRLMHEQIPSEASNGSQEHSTTIPDDTISLSSTSSLSLLITQRQKQWTTDAAGVPHFLCILSKKNHLLFACDKFGSIDLYQLDSTNPKNAPRHLRHFELFPGNTTNKQPQIIETFTVYTPFIVVAARMFKRLFMKWSDWTTDFRFEWSDRYEFDIFLRSSWVSAGRNMFTKLSRSTIVGWYWLPMSMGSGSTSTFR